jgi:hypothetical protein
LEIASHLRVLLLEDSDSFFLLQIRLDDMPSRVVFDVLVVPGSEQLSALLASEPALPRDDDEKAKAPFLARLLARL